MALSHVQQNSVLVDQENVHGNTVADPNNNAQRISAVKKCLFGAADPEDTARLLQEQFESDRQRFLSRFGIDVVNLENTENGKKKSGKLKAESKKVSRENRALKPYNRQSKITDFCKMKKHSKKEKK